MFIIDILCALFIIGYIYTRMSTKNRKTILYFKYNKMFKSFNEYSNLL